MKASFSHSVNWSTVFRHVFLPQGWIAARVAIIPRSIGLMESKVTSKIGSRGVRLETEVAGVSPSTWGQRRRSLFRCSLDFNNNLLWILWFKGSSEKFKIYIGNMKNRIQWIRTKCVTAVVLSIFYLFIFDCVWTASPTHFILIAVESIIITNPNINLIIIFILN